MHVIETTVYEYAELSDSAQEKARSWYRDVGFDHDWYDATFELVKQAGAALGIRVDRIHFSGFWSQGDGACFEGAFVCRPDWRDTLLDAEFVPGELLEHLEGIGYDLESAWKYEGHGDEDAEGCVTVEHSDRYCHEHSVTFSYDAGAAMKRALRDFMRWIYRTLQAEYEHLTSDDAIAETIEANEYTFTEDGTRFG